MNMHDAITQGTHGVTVEIPEHFELQTNKPFIALLLDQQLGITWHLMWAPHLHMDLRPAHRTHLESRAARHARQMFEQVHAEVGHIEEPRTHDESWSPMIALSYHDLHGHAVLETLHRMAYEPGLEIIMGHLLIPVAGGLIELRAQSKEFGSTGLRESMVLAQQKAPTSFPSQAIYDDPELDEMFPDLVLSRMRRAMHDMLPRITSITTPQSLTHNESFTSLDPACTLTLPPRVHPDDRGELQRTSFCITDGLDHVVLNGSGTRASADKLPALAVASLTPMHESAGVEHVNVTTSVIDEKMISAVVRGQGHQEIRNVFVWWLDENSRVWEIGIMGDTRSPDQELIDELVTSARTLVPAKRKKFLGIF